MQFIKFIEDIFSNHPVLSVAFSGFGLSLISSLIYIIRKILTLHKHSNQKMIFLRYYSKYKKHFCQDDAEALKQQSSIAYPNYSSLLNQLLGLIEALNNN